MRFAKRGIRCCWKDQFRHFQHFGAKVRSDFEAKKVWQMKKEIELEKRRQAQALIYAAGGFIFSTICSDFFRCVLPSDDNQYVTERPMRFMNWPPMTNLPSII
jgi:predicted LPLAT superfamily acyltransferase